MIWLMDASLKGRWENSRVAASNNFYPPSVQPSWVAVNDCIDIAQGSAYYGDDATLIFSGTVVLQET